MKIVKKVVIITIIIVFMTGCIDISSSSTSEKERNNNTNFNDTNFVSITNKTMITGESWDVGNGWALSIVSIDSNTKDVRFVLSKDGVKIDEPTIKIRSNYLYTANDRFFCMEISDIEENIDTVILENIKYRVD